MTPRAPYDNYIFTTRYFTMWLRTSKAKFNRIIKIFRFLTNIITFEPSLFKNIYVSRRKFYIAKYWNSNQIEFLVAKKDLWFFNKLLGGRIFFLIFFKIEITHRYTFALDAIHDAKRWTQICIPRGAKLPNLFAEDAFCNNKKNLMSVQVATIKKQPLGWDYRNYDTREPNKSEVSKSKWNNGKRWKIYQYRYATVDVVSSLMWLRPNEASRRGVVALLSLALVPSCNQPARTRNGMTSLLKRIARASDGDLVTLFFFFFFFFIFFIFFIFCYYCVIFSPSLDSSRIRIRDSYARFFHLMDFASTFKLWTAIRRDAD